MYRLGEGCSIKEHIFTPVVPYMMFSSCQYMRPNVLHFTLH